MKANDKKIVVITGAGDGIGRALAAIYMSHGATVIINDISKSKLNESKKLLQGGFTFEADISKKDEVQAFSKYVKNNFGKVDVLINNAGVSIGRLDAVDIPNDLNEWIFGVNYWGTVYSVNSFLPLIPMQSGSKIVNVCSLYSYLSVYHRSAYCASKSALKACSDSLRYEMKDKKIDVVTVFPGMVNTHIIQNSRGWNSENEKLAASNFQQKYASLTSESAANKIFKGIVKNKKRIHIGIDTKLTFYLLKFLPQRGEEWINSVIRNSELRFKRRLAMVNG